MNRKSVYGKKGEVPTWVVGIIIVFIVFIGITFFFPRTLEAGFDVIGFRGATSINEEAVIAKCALYCLDDNETEFCEKEYSGGLRLAGKRLVEGTCGSIGDVGIRNFDGIPKCGKFDCPAGGEEATCYLEGKKVDCDGWLSDAEKKELEEVAEAKRLVEEAEKERLAEEAERLVEVEKGKVNVAQMIEDVCDSNGIYLGSLEGGGEFMVDLPNRRGIKMYVCRKSNLKNCLLDFGEGKAYLYYFGGSGYDHNFNLVDSSGITPLISPNLYEKEIKTFLESNCDERYDFS